MTDTNIYVPNTHNVLADQKLKVGDIVDCDYGATMQLPTFYKVVKTTKCTAQIVRLKDKSVPVDGSNGFYGKKMPTDVLDPNGYNATLTVRFYKHAGSCAATHGSAGSKIFFYKWNGLAKDYNHLD